MVTHKHSIGLSYGDMSKEKYSKLDFELGLPGADAASFFKVDAFMTKAYSLKPEYLKLVWQL